MTEDDWEQIAELARQEDQEEEKKAKKAGTFRLVASLLLGILYMTVEWALRGFFIGLGYFYITPLLGGSEIALWPALLAGLITQLALSAAGKSLLGSRRN